MTRTITLDKAKTMSNTVENLREGDILATVHEDFAVLFLVVNVKPGHNAFGDEWVELTTTAQHNGVTRMVTYSKGERVTMACDCGKGHFCPQFGSAFSGGSRSVDVKRSGAFKVAVTVTVEVDPEAYAQAYGGDPASIREEAREFVKNSMTTTMLNSAGIFASDSGIEVVRSR